MSTAAAILIVLTGAAAGPAPPAGAVLCFDEAHRNVHLAAGSYAPVVTLAAEVGLSPRVIHSEWTSEALAGCGVVLTAGPRGAGKDRPLPERGQPAFTAGEVSAIAGWVEDGGGFLLVTDHAPIGSATAPLAAWLGVEMSDAFAEDPDHGGPEPGEIVFTRGAGLAGGHPIVEGRSAAERVDRVSTFVGQSLAGPPGSLSLLILGPGAVDRVRRSPDGFVWEDPSPADRLMPAGGRSQALALRVGGGRVVVLGEAAMLTERGLSGSNHNRRFALNLLRWLAGPS